MKYLNALWKNHYSRRILFAGIIYALSITSMIVGARLCYREDESGLSKKIGTYFFEGGLVGAEVSSIGGTLYAISRKKRLECLAESFKNHSH